MREGKAKAEAAKKPARKPRKAKPAAELPKAYAEYREKQAAISRDRAAKGQEIGPIPAVVDPARREACRLDLRRFCETYLRPTFEWKFSPDHLAALERLQSCALTGGQFAFAMPRGSGKSCMSEAGALWAVLYGHRRFVFLVAATDDKAKQSIESIRTDLELNELLAADFPEVCYPIAALEGEPRRANGQKLDGEPTRLKLADDRLIMPVVPGSKASGAWIKAAGITSSDCRGPKVKTAEGKTMRPDLAIVDDPQTDESATSLTQIRKRENVINRSVLGMAGPGKKIAAFMPCTVIAPNDLADRLLDRDRSPAWQGQRTRMVVSWPKRSDLWDKYAEIRREDQRNGDQHGARAAAMYREQRAEMDEGGSVSWEERYGREGSNEISAIQHAYNLRIDKGDPAFNAEYQNDPDPIDLGAVQELNADDIAAKLNGCPRGHAPADVTRVTGGIDVGKGILFWVVVGWTEDFRGHVVDYGTYPKQARPDYFDASNPKPSVSDLHPSLREDAQIYAGLKSTLPMVLDRVFPRVGGGEFKVERCLVDRGKWPKPVTDLCRVRPEVLLPSRGWGVGKGKPMWMWEKKQGERRGDHWMLRQETAGGFGRVLYVDVNHWKSFAARGLSAPELSAGCIQLFGDKPGVHELFADHMTAEYRSGKWSSTGDQAEQEVWSVKPDRRDSNHWWDCLVMAAAGASYSGVSWSAAGAAGDPPPPKRERKRVSLLAAMQAQEQRAVYS